MAISLMLEAQVKSFLARFTKYFQTCKLFLIHKLWAEFANGYGTVVEHLPLHLKVQGSNTIVAADTGGECGLT
jgi:hypothetical protein